MAASLWLTQEENMLSLFHQFVIDLTSSDKSDRELERLVDRYQGAFEVKSGQQSDLGTRIHEEVENCIVRISMGKSGEVDSGQMIPLSEGKLRIELLQTLKYIASSYSTINPSSGLTHRDLAEHFVAHVFDPLLAQSKQLDAIFNYAAPLFEASKPKIKQNFQPK